MVYTQICLIYAQITVWASVITLLVPWLIQVSLAEAVVVMAVAVVVVVMAVAVVVMMVVMAMAG